MNKRYVINSYLCFPYLGYSPISCLNVHWKPENEVIVAGGIGNDHRADATAVVEQVAGRD